MVRRTNTRCGDCGATLHEYELYDPETAEADGTHQVCPNEWRESHP